MSRPLAIVGIILLGLAAFNLLGAARAVDRWDDWSSLPLAVPPAYLLLRGLFWAVMFVVLPTALWRQWPWARWVAWIGLAVYLAQGWLDRLVLMPTADVRVASLWRLGLDAGLMLIVGLCLRRSTRPARPPNRV